MFIQPEREFITSWHGEKPKTQLITVPVCFTKAEWDTYFVAAYYAATINVHRRRPFSETEALKVSCAEDCDLANQYRMQKMGRCKPVNWKDTPIGRIEALAESLIA